MTRRGSVFLAALVAASLAAESARAVTLYREDFPGAGGSLASVGWDGANIGVDIGSGANSAGVTIGGVDEFHWWFNNTTIALATPITEMSLTNEFAPIPTGTPGLTISWEQRLERQFDDNFVDVPGTGTGVDARIAVQVGGQWYASATAYPTGNTTPGTFTSQSFAFDGTAANWLVVNDVDATPGVTLGAAAGGNLAGVISGLGIVSTFAQQQTVNFNFVEISGVPEPASWSLLACGGLGVAAFRRRRAG